jgi:hypothetical protein
MMTTALLAAGLAACHATPGWVGDATVAGAPPAGSPTGPYGARAVVGTEVSVFSASPAGLVVGGGADNTNPGNTLPGLRFVPVDTPARSFLWAFAPGIALRDQDCRPIDQAAAIATVTHHAGSDISALFIDYLGADGKPMAPAKLQIWVRGKVKPASCVAEDKSHTR